MGGLARSAAGIGHLNIVHFSTSDREGGSARSARRISDHLQRLGHRSRMLVGYRSGVDPDTDTVHGGGVRRLADRLAEEATRRVGLQYFWYPSGRRVLRHPWVTSADVIQLYNTHGGYFSHRLLPALAAHAPLVWRLSDMWALTGHCAYSGRCDRWRTGCGACPDLATYPGLPRDTTRLLWRAKKSIYARARPVIVAPSRWLEEIARESPLFAGLPVHRIPSGIDRSVFRPIPKPAARELLGLPPDARIVLYVAQVLDDNARKGSADAIAACHALKGRAAFDLAVLGSGGASWREKLPQTIHALGYVHDERLLAASYAAADLTIVPSRVENLPNSILESLACGTPVVAYDSGGIGDVVRHEETGLLARTGAREALADAMARLLADAALRERLSRNAVALIAKEFDAAREARAFADLFASLTSRPREAGHAAG